MKKKLLVVLLALALVFSFGVAASADSGDVTVTTKIGENVVTQASVGQTVKVEAVIESADLTAGATYELKFGDSTAARGTATEDQDLTLTANWTASKTASKAWTVMETIEGSASSSFDTGTLDIEVVDNALDSLSVDGTPVEVGNSMEHHVASDKTEAAIVAAAASDKYEVKYSPELTDGKLALSAATTTVTITVAPKDPESTLASKNYTLKIYKDADKAELTSLGSLKPNSADKVTGKVDFGYKTDITLTAEYVGKSISIDSVSGAKSVTVDGNKVVITGIDGTDKNDRNVTFKLKVNPIDEKAASKIYDVTIDPYKALDLKVYLAGDEGGKYLNEKVLADYTVTVDEDDEKLTLRIYWDDDKNDYDITVKYGKDKIDSFDRNDSRKDYAECEIDVDPSDLENIKITVEDNDDSANDKTFTIKLDGSGSNGDAILGKLAVYDKSKNGEKYTLIPSLDEDILEYYVFIPYDKSGADVYVEAEADGKDYEVRKTITGSEQDDRFKIGSVDPGDDAEFKFYVVNEDDDDDYNEYILNVRMADKNDDGDENTLEDIELFSGTSASKCKSEVDLSFKASTTKYSVAVDEDQKYLKVEVSKEDKNSYVFINGKEVTKDTIALSKGKNTIEIVVVAENCDDTKTYTITVNRGGSLGIVKYLSVTGLANTMSPSFSDGVLNYVGYVNPGTSSVSVYAQGDSTKDKVYISCTRGGSGYATADGSATATIKLADGINVIAVWASGDSSGSSLIKYYISIYKPVSSPKVTLSSQKVTVNGTSKGTISAYNIEGNNFLQLRDVAVLLNGTSDQFNVSYNSSTGTAVITTNSAYVANGTENAATSRFKNNGITKQTFTLNGANVYPIAYNINGSNYVLLRDMAALMDFGITYSSSTNTININTTNNYTPGL